jgi:hypothetical protein
MFAMVLQVGIRMCPGTTEMRTLLSGATIPEISPIPDEFPGGTGEGPHDVATAKMDEDIKKPRYPGGTSGANLRRRYNVSI